MSQTQATAVQQDDAAKAVEQRRQEAKHVADLVSAHPQHEWRDVFLVSDRLQSDIAMALAKSVDDLLATSAIRAELGLGWIGQREGDKPYKVATDLLNAVDSWRHNEDLVKEFYFQLSDKPGMKGILKRYNPPDVL